MRNVCTASAMALALGLGACQLSQADVVSRPPAGTADTEDGAVRDSSDDGDVETRPAVRRDSGKDARDGKRLDGQDVLPPVGENAGAWDAAGPAVNTPPEPLPNGCNPLHGTGFVFCDDFEAEADLEQWSTSDTGADGGSPTTPSWDIAYVWKDDGSVNGVFGPVDANTSAAFVAAQAWSDMTVEAWVNIVRSDRSSLSERVEVYARYVDWDHCFAVSLSSDGSFGLRQGNEGLGSVVQVNVKEQEWHLLKIRVSGMNNPKVEGFLDGVLMVVSDASLALNKGTAGLGVHGTVKAQFDEVRVWSP